MEEGEALMVKSMKHLIFVVDTSKGMVGAPISEVNRAMSDVVDALVTHSNKLDFSKIYISVLTYNNVFGHVLTSPIIGYTWYDKHIDTDPHISFALDELDQLLTNNAKTGKYSLDTPPTIIYIYRCKQAGYEWYHELERLCKNDWYMQAAKRAIAYKSDDVDFLADIVGDRSMILETQNLDELKARLLECVSSAVGTPIDIQLAEV